MHKRRYTLLTINKYLRKKLFAFFRILLSPEDKLELDKYKDENGRTIPQMANLHSSHDWTPLMKD